MTISKDLFLSILSMDAYNRGYNRGTDGLGNLGSQVGAATITAQSDTSPNSVAVTASFYAVTYTVGAGVEGIASGSTVISYRGTDQGAELTAVDLPMSYLGAGEQTEVALAWAYAKAVAQNLPGPLLLTGHSLGGALAGMAGALTGHDSDVVDHIGYRLAIENLLTAWNSPGLINFKLYLGPAFTTFEQVEAQYAIDHGLTYTPGTDHPMGILYEGTLARWSFFKTAGLTGTETIDTTAVLAFLDNPAHSASFFVEGSVAALTRLDFRGPVSTPILGSYLQSFTSAYGITSIEAHSASLNVIMKFAEQESSKPAFLNFIPALQFAAPALFSDTIGESAGFTVANAGGVSSASAKMRDAIAYSALEVGTVFGNVGIRALFDDLGELGTRLGANPLFLERIEEHYPFFGNDLALPSVLVEASVQFAGTMAQRKVVSATGADVTLQGILRFSRNGVSTVSPQADLEAGSADVMFVDLSPGLWNIGGTSVPTTSPKSLTDWIDGALGFHTYVMGTAGSTPAEQLQAEAIASAALIFDSVYGPGYTARGWTDHSLTGQYLSGASFLIGQAGVATQLAEYSLGTAPKDPSAIFAVFGTVDNDSIVGTQDREVYLLGKGDDSIQAGAGSDIVLAGVGNDTILGGKGDDLLVGDPKLPEDSQVEVAPGNDLIQDGDGTDTMIGGEGDDTIIGAANLDTQNGGSHGHSNIFGGLGNDSIEGGDGADFLFDYGVDAPWAYANGELLIKDVSHQYDTTGNDTLHGGKGSDQLFSSGGNDVLYGGAGDDTYLVTGEAATSGSASDHLEIHVADSAAEAALGFGHDLILGDGKGIDKLIFDGINRSDISLHFDYHVVSVTKYAANFNPIFPWTFDPQRWEASVYKVEGSLEIVVNSTGSSVTIQNVGGAYSVSGPGWPYSTLAEIGLTPFQMQFDDGILNLTAALTGMAGGLGAGSGGGPGAGLSFPDTPLGTHALDAMTSMATERSQVENSLAGGNGNDQITGGNASDGMYGGGGNDLLTGRFGDDYMVGGTGGDTLDGGDGIDTASYATASAAVNLDLGGGAFNPSGDALGDLFISIENVEGTAFNDSISGDSGNNMLSGSGGNDYLIDYEGSNTLIGGAGDDTLDSRYFGATSDTLGHSSLDGGAGNDTLWAFGGSNTVRGGDGNDSISITSQVSSYFPTTYNAGNDVIDGGAGTDLVVFGHWQAGTVIDMVAGRADLGGTGTTVLFTGVENVTGSSYADTVIGDAGANLIRGDAGDDLLYGGGGNDTIWGDAGTNRIYGGLGTDIARISANRADVTFSFLEGGIRGQTTTGAVFTIYNDVENVQFNDLTQTYAQIAAPLQTAFDVIGDFQRLTEGQTFILSPLANDLPFAANALQLVRLNGAAVSLGQVLRLASGATVEVLAGNQLRYDQAGAYAWLDAGETGTDTLTYSASDITGVVRTASITFVVDGAASAATMTHTTTGVVFANSDPLQPSAVVVANFDIGHGVVVVNERLIDPNAVNPGVTLQESAGDTYVNFGDDAVILSDISLAAWAYRSSARLAGGAGSDSLAGTANADVILSGAGNDTIQGNGGYDLLAGGTGNDYITLGANGGMAFGEDGNDSLSGGGASDTLYGNNNDDYLFGKGGNDSQFGGEGNDFLSGEAGDDQLFGGMGDDTINGGPGFDSIDGGAGQDLLDLQPGYIDTTMPGFVVDLGLGHVDWNDGSYREFFANMEGAYGGGGSDTMLGDANANTFYGSAGSDQMFGGAGNDTLSDEIGNDVMYGGDGDDWLYDTNGTDRLYGGAGNDLIQTYVGADTIDGGAGIDTLYLTSAVVAVDANLVTGAGPSGSLLVGIENLTGSYGANRLTGDAGANRLDGDGGNDTLIGGAGNDTLIGGVGANDTAIFAGTFASYTYTSVDGILILTSAAEGVDQVAPDLEYLQFADITYRWNQLGSIIVAGTAGDDLINLSYVDADGHQTHNDSLSGDTLMGNEGNDTLLGYAGTDVLYGGSGNDSLDGGTGVDRMVGGTGNDIFVVDNAGDIVVEVAGEGIDLVQASVAVTLWAEVETLVLTGTGNLAGTGNALNNSLTGTSGNNALQGMEGADSLSGLAGNDSLDGGTGVDTLVGGTGNDTYTVDETGDLVIEAAGEGTDAVLSSATFLLSSDIETLTLTGTANINGTGNALANSLTGNAGDNALDGQAGNDTISTGTGNDTLIGGTGADSMTGGTGDDLYVVDDLGDKTVEVSTGGLDGVLSSISLILATSVENLTLTGTAAAGTGNSSANILVGNGAANTLTGLGGVDTIDGGAGNDTLDGGALADSLVGGTGDDLYLVDDTNDLVVEDPGAGLDLVQSSATFILSGNVENLTLTGTTGLSGTGNTLGNLVTGNTGANLLSGLDGSDTILAGLGNDTLDGGTGADSLAGGAGNDLYIVDQASDILVELAAEGTDLVQSSVTWTLGAEFESLTLAGSLAINGTGTALANAITGNAAANLLSGLAGNDTLSGGDGNDTLDGGAGADALTGGLGDDLFIIDDAGDTVSEGTSGGTDLVQSAVTHTLAVNVENLTLTGAALVNGTGNAVANLILGNGAANLLAGLGGDDLLSGGAGNDTLDGGTGLDQTSGGTGDDLYIVDQATDLVTELAAQGNDTVQSSVAWTLGTDVEALILTGTVTLAGTGNALANTMTGNSGGNLLTGLAGNDTLDGGAGADTLDGGTGNDSLIGGAGNDLFLVDSLQDAVVELAAGGTDSVQASISYTLGTEVETLALTGSSALSGTGNALANSLTGNGAANLLQGLAGADTLTAGDGNDTLDGGTEVDSLVGGLGDDLYLVDATTDVAVEASAAGLDTVQSSATFTLGLNLESLVLTGTLAISGTGNTSANTLTGNGAANLLSGSGGTDTLYGGAGNDTLDGGATTDSMAGGTGDDLYVVDVATDVVTELAAEGTDTVQSAVTWTLAANFENLVLTGTLGNAGTGNGVANLLTGNSGANALSGLAGNDTLIGGAGNDAESGGTGADHFVYSSTTSGVDVIADFNELDGGAEEGDVLRFDGLRVGVFVYLGTGAFTGGLDNSEARISGNQVLVDTNGDATADITITLTGLTSAAQLAVTDFLFV